MCNSNRRSCFDEFLVLDTASIPGNSNHATWNVMRWKTKFDGDILSTLDHVSRFATYTSKFEVIHLDVLIFLFMRSLQGHISWLHNCKPKIISTIKAFFDGFLKHVQACQPLDSQEQGFNEHCEDLGKNYPSIHLNIDINGYLHIEEGKWEVHGHTFDKDPIYDTDDDDANRTLVFPHNPWDVFGSHVDPFLNPSYIITYNEESFLSPKYDNHEQISCCASPCHQTPFPSNHDLMVAMKHNINDKDHDEDDMPEVAIHQKFISLILDISIFWLQERIPWSRLHPFIPSSPMILHVRSFYFPTSRPRDLPYGHSCPSLWIYCMRIMCSHIDWIICWLHWVYDYT